MHTKDSLIAQLSAMLPSDATVLMHSSCKSLGQMENGGDTILDALTEYFSRGLVVLPTHTWATVNDRQPVYDVLYTPVCIGLLPELFRKRPGVHRSWHPTHSVAAFGADAEEFVRGDENCPTPCARDSAWGRLYDRDAYVLLVGVELNRDAVQDAIGNAKHNGVKNARFFAADATRWISEAAAAGERADVIFMDPPREGSTPQFIESVARMAPKRVVYVSCNPETLARDLALLTKKGYRVESSTPVDMFPHSEHIEVVCALSRRHKA